MSRYRRSAPIQPIGLRFSFAMTLVELGSMLVLCGCESALTYSAASRYAGHRVRAVVTDVATRAQMRDNWESGAKNLIGVPPKDVFASHYKRIRVRAENYIGGAYFAQPFIADGLEVAKGDVVDLLAPPPGGIATWEEAQKYAIYRVVCSVRDLQCMTSNEGRRRGIID